MPPSTVSILTSKSATRCRVVPAFPRIFLCICAGALFYERAWSRNARGAGKPQHKQAPRREKSLRRFWSRRRDYLRLYGQVESRGFYERLDGFATAGVRSREPTAENKASHFQTFRRLWFKPLTTAKTPRRQKCHLGVLVEATGFEPTTSWSRTKRATKLRYASNGEYYIKPNALLQAISMRQFISYDFFGCFRGGAALPPSAKSAQRTGS